MTRHAPVAYAFDAALHCVNCTAKRFPPRQGEDYVLLDANGIPTDRTDREGNRIHPVDPWSGDERGEVCDDCLQPLD